MKCDFSGWATKADVKCTDGRTINPNAFEHQDTMQVPLVWQHGHKDVENVLGHVLLENRDEGVYCYAFFNDTPKAKHAKQAVEHKDINQMSIWANDLIERSKRVMHGAIREVSLVLSGANPGAVIKNIQLRHSEDDELETLEDEAIITTGLKLEHAELPKDLEDDAAAGDAGDDDLDGRVATEVERQLQLAHAAEDPTIQDVFESMSDDQKDVVYFMVGTALESTSAEHSNLGDEANDDKKGKESMGHNVFEKDAKGGTGSKNTLAHSDLEAIKAEAKRGGSLKHAVEAYAEEHLEHGIQDIDTLFPDAKAISNTPEMLSRRVEWVGKLMGGITKRPFARIKTLSADITVPEARAKGYITGSLKKEEFFKVLKRVTEPTTVYKKQKLDRDDMIDITDFDVVAWLKAEMRQMLDEEIARAILLGDGRAGDHEDKINEEKIRPIVSDHELYTTTVNVNINDASSNMSEVSDKIALSRKHLRGSGLPTMFTTETYIAMFLTQRDSLGRRLYTSLDQLATELRVSEIVAVEVMEEYEDIVAVLVNPADYAVGSNAGGEVSMFDDFDIDYNEYKYLIEGRCSGALTKLKSALVVKKVAGTDVLVEPASPTFDPESGEVTIVNTTGVVYRNLDTDAVIDNAGSPYELAEGETLNVHATPASGKYFADSTVDDWSFTRPEA